MYAQPMPITQVLLILRARWRVLFGVWLGIVLFVVAFCLLWPPKYTASASLVVDVQSPDPVGNVMLGGSFISSYMATQLDVMRSERVVLRAIRAVGLQNDPDFKEKWQSKTEGQGDYESWLADEVLNEFVIKPTRGSNALTIDYRSRYPERAAAMANALIKAYMDVVLEMRTQPAREYNSFFDQHSRQLRDALEAAQSKLSSFQQSSGLLATDERFDVETMRLNELSSQVIGLRKSVTEADERRVQATNDPGRMAEVLNNPTVYQLNTEIATSQARLEELSLRLGDSHPRVLELQANLAELNRRLATATRQASNSTSVASEVARANYQRATASLEEQRAKVLRLKALRDEAAVLQRDVENMQKAYETTLARLTQSSMESQARPINVSVIKQASEPGVPTFPRPMLMTAASIVVGALVAVGIAMGREYFDQRLRTATDVTLALNQPLLARVPRAAVNERETTKRLAFKKRVLSGTPRTSTS